LAQINTPCRRVADGAHVPTAAEAVAARAKLDATWKEQAKNFGVTRREKLVKRKGLRPKAAADALADAAAVVCYQLFYSYCFII
jgi:hypothetical protein